MDDQQVWEEGLRFIKQNLAGLTPAKSDRLTALLAGYRQQKETLAGIAQQIDSGKVCGVCAGKCCQNGKYRINVFDLVAHYTEGVEVSPDFRQKPLCPYGTVRGCRMEPGLRPADCILFLCEALDSQLPDSARSVYGLSEKKLRDNLHEASLLLDMPVATPLLLWAEKMCTN